MMNSEASTSGTKVSFNLNFDLDTNIEEDNDYALEEL